MPNTFITWRDKKNTRRRNYFHDIYIFKPRTNYTSPLSSSSVEYFATVPLKNVEFFRVDSLNSTFWSKILIDSSEGKTSTNLDNSIIIDVDKKMHIIYEVEIKNRPRFLNHIVIDADNSVFEKDFTMWNTKYIYRLNQGKLIDGKTLIVPAVKGNRMEFAKIKLE